MSAEVLRRAAVLMRERADAATPSPWKQDGVEGSLYNDQVTAPHRTGNPAFCTGVADTDTSDENARHIASWHPDVALAVADWLDYTAKEHDRHACGLALVDRALRVARAYLGDRS